MSKIHIHDVEELSWTTVRDLTAGHEPPGLSDDDRDARIIFHEPGDKDSPQLFEVNYGPNAHIAVHAHDEDEIMYVVGGEMIFGTRVLKPGSSIFIGGGAFYSFSTGAEGLRFLNFRPRADLTYHLKKTDSPTQTA